MAPPGMKQRLRNGEILAGSIATILSAASAQTIAAAGIPLGALALTREYTKSLLALGYRLPAHGADVVMLGNLVRHTAEWRQAEN